MTLMQMIETPYYFYEILCRDELLWNAYARPKNPKTGKAWQAKKPILTNTDAYVICNLDTGKTEKVMGKPEGKWSNGGSDNHMSLHIGYSSKEAVLASIEAHKTRMEKNRNG